MLGKNGEKTDDLDIDNQDIPCANQSPKEAQKSVPMCSNAMSPKKRWASALHVVTAMARFRNMPRHRNNQRCDGGTEKRNAAEASKIRTASSSFSGSSESMPNSGGKNDDETNEQESESNIDPVYLALKEATTKYGSKVVKNRRFSQNIGAGSGDSAPTPSSCSRNLSQASLLDSGTFSASGDYGGGGIGTDSHSNSGTRLFPMSGGSTPQLEADIFSSVTNPTNRGSRIKLTEKMKSFSLDCAEPPTAADQHQQHGIAGVYPNYRLKQLRNARTLNSTSHTESFDQCFMKRSSSPPAVTFSARRMPRRLPTVPDQQTKSPITVQQSLQNSPAFPSILHIVTHEYVGADCALRPGERLVVVDNGDPDWKHGFKLNDRSERLFTFPSTCIAAYRTEEEQPMRLIQTCNLMDQKMRLYRDQVVFVQPNSLGEDGRVTVRNEHDKFVKCPLQFLILA